MNKVLSAVVILYILVLGGISVLRHYNFQTQTWDMGAFEQTFWNTVHGRVMFNNLEEVRSHLGVHMSPWLLVLVPGYWIFQSPYYLLSIQTLALALGAWPLYLLARRVLQREKLSFLIVLGYLSYPSLHWVNSFDFHEISFFVPLMLAALYFIEARKWGWAWLFLALSASVEENAAIAVGFVGLYLLFLRNRESNFWTKKRKNGVLIIASALVYFLISVKVIMPALGGGLLRLDRYANLGNTPSEIITNVVTKPSILLATMFTGPKLVYLLWLFLPVAFLPLFSWRSLILIIPGLFQNLLTFYKFQFTSFYQYDAVLIPGIWVGSIYGLKIILEKWPGRGKLAWKVLLTTIILGLLLRSPLNPLSFPIELFKSKPRWEAFRQMVKMTPSGVSVAAHTNLVPHLSHREHAYMLGREPFPVDVVLIDSADSFGFPDKESFETYIKTYLDSGRYAVKVIDERYLVLIRSDLLK